MSALLPLAIALVYAGTVRSVDECFVEEAGRSAEDSAGGAIPVILEGTKLNPADAQKLEDQAVSAVIDRIEDGVAVVLVGVEEREMTCSANSLPSGVRAGGAVRLRLDGDRILNMEADPDEDAVRVARIGAKLKWLQTHRGANRKQWPDLGDAPGQAEP